LLAITALFAIGLVIGCGNSKPSDPKAAVIAMFGAMEKDAAIKISELRVDGGAVVNDLLMQVQANLTGHPVVRPECIETTALGAAYLAGLGSGFWSSVEEIMGQWAVDRTFEDQLADLQRKELKIGWQKAIDRSRSWHTAQESR
jgi:glycerol kinase